MVGITRSKVIGCLKDSKIQPGQKLLKGLVESQAISTSPQAASNCHAGGIGKADSDSSGQPDDP